MMKCPQVSQHSVYLFYPFYFESTTQSTVRNNVLEKIEALKISDVIDALYLPDKLKERLSEKKLKDIFGYRIMNQSLILIWKLIMPR